ncbi:hypothetical protein ACJX0J_021776, partial [Zea mays]
GSLHRSIVSACRACKNMMNTAPDVPTRDMRALLIDLPIFVVVVVGCVNNLYIINEAEVIDKYTTNYHKRLEYIERFSMHAWHWHPIVFFFVSSSMKIIYAKTILSYLTTTCTHMFSLQLIYLENSKYPIIYNG